MQILKSWDFLDCFHHVYLPLHHAARHIVWAVTANAPLFERSHRDQRDSAPVHRLLAPGCTARTGSVCIFSTSYTYTKRNLSSFRERLKLKQDLNSAIYILFRFYWRVSTHTVKIKSPAEPISWDQCIPILKAKRTRLCQVKIRAKTFHTSVLSTAAKNSKATERKMLPAVHKEPLQHNINLCTLI